LDDTHDNDNNEYDSWIRKRLNGILRNDGSYDLHPTTPKSLEDWASWVSKAIRHETGLKLSEKQELLILRGFFFAVRDKGFDMYYCAEEKPRASST
jgi:hypothetical protein